MRAWQRWSRTMRSMAAHSQKVPLGNRTCGNWHDLEFPESRPISKVELGLARPKLPDGAEPPRGGGGGWQEKSGKTENRNQSLGYTPFSNTRSGCSVKAVNDLLTIRS